MSYIERNQKDPDHDLDSWSRDEEKESSLYGLWIAAKEEERNITETRRILEDRMIADLRINDTIEGVSNYSPMGFKVKVTNRMNRRVDADKLIELAAESGIDNDHLQALFRWKPELNLREWQNAASDITKPLEAAITTKPGRPSFSIIEE